MLLHAHENQYAVMAINCVNMEQAKAIIESAEEEKAPVIINNFSQANESSWLRRYSGPYDQRNG